jgi:hypothetical protein
MKHLRIKYTLPDRFAGSNITPAIGTLAIFQKPFTEVFYEAIGPPKRGNSGRLPKTSPSLELTLAQRDHLQDS